MRWVFLILAVVANAVRSQEICLSGEEDPYLMFGTKTAYIFATKGIPNTKAHEVPGCQPIAFWSLNRHGSHNPGTNEIIELQKLADLRNNIVANYRTGNFRDTNQRICQSDLNLLQAWQWDSSHNLTYADELTSDGYMTTQQIAQAWKQRFPGVLTPNRHNYMFKFVNDKRSSSTFRAFTEGLFGAQGQGFDIPRENDEKLLRPYKFCPAWTRDVEENNNTLLQLQIFESKQEYKDMISNISARMGFNYDIQKEIIQNMYQICRYSKSWDVIQISPWCAAFTKDDLKRLEYAEDLETYYKYGYGSELNKKIGCTLIKDMMDFFGNHVSHDTPQQPSAMIHFTEAPMIMMTLAAMGSRQDAAPLTGDNYHTNAIQARQWTTSTLAPFNANLAAALYKCSPNGNFQVHDKYQVLFLENEKPMYFEGCRVGLCDWSYVKNKFGDTANRCNLEFCNGATKINSVLAVSIAVITFCVNI